MKINEVRLYNFISDGFFLYRVAKIENGIILGFSTLDGFDFYPDTLYSLNEENLQGVPLTTVWLKRFGMESFGDNNEYWKLIDVPEVELLDQGESFRVFDSDGITLCWLSCVHELQNLYFALTGEELEIHA